MKLPHKLMFLLGAPFLLAACGKSYTCTQNIDYFGPNMVFKGFSSNQLSQVLIKEYKANTNFAELIQVDTLDASGGYMKGDTMLIRDDNTTLSGFAPVSIKVGTDYRIIITSTNQTYEITAVAKGNDTRSWTQKDECAPGASEAILTSLSMKLNGVDYACFQIFNMSNPVGYLMCLNH